MQATCCDQSLNAEFVIAKTHDDVRKMTEVDVWVMALPNGVAKPWVDAIEEGNHGSIIVDLSADYRFDTAWTYGLPELIDRSKIAKANRISNPGCYAVSILNKKDLIWNVVMPKDVCPEALQEELIRWHPDGGSDRDCSFASSYR